jgi:SAM-dependent methyltransferase
MQNDKTDLLNEIAAYYSGKIAEHGKTPRGVDWNGEESQILRFEQLSKIIRSDAQNISLTDFGCGYGALLDFMSARYSVSSYLGVDVSLDMVQSAKSRHKAVHNARFIVAAEPDTVMDYGIASGIFNVRQGRTDAEWFDYLMAMLDVLNSTCRHGFAFNCLTSYSDKEKKRDYLYYADPCKLFDLCKHRFSRHIALLHDYGLYEFTILVRRVP